MLDGHRARGAALLRCVMTAPWSVAVADHAAVGILVPVRGPLWLTHRERTLRLDPGDVAILTGGVDYVLGDDPSTVPTVVIEPGQVCRTVDASAVPMDFGFGLRTWGNGADGECAFLSGTYELAGQVTGGLIGSVPELVVVRADDWDAPLVPVLVAEFGRDAAGQDVVLDRLTDLVLIAALRAWFEGPGAGSAPRWWVAQQDPLVGNVLRQLHDRPDLPWTLDTLAASVDVSRATLARRFTHLLGTAPMGYLTQWRLSQAADLLRGTDDTVEAVGRRVGYANAFAFSTAFKRRFGASPRAYRQAG